MDDTIHERQAGYYAVLRECGRAGNSTAFIEFMLQAVADTLSQSEATTDPVSDPLTDPVATPTTEQVLQQSGEHKDTQR